MSIGKIASSDGSLIWMRNWSTHYPDTQAWSLDVYNDAIYVVGTTFGIRGSFICKFDLDGNLLWNKIIIGGNTDIKVYQNNLYLCGITNRMSYVVKYDINGNKIWEKTYEIPGTWLSKLQNIVIYNDYIYTSGYTNSHDGTIQDILVMKISIDGELLWYREWGGPGWELDSGIDVYDDYIYVCGDGAEIFPLGNRDYILKYDLDGELQWDTSSLCTPASAFDIIVYNGSIFTVGEFWKGYDNGWDIVLRKFDVDSNLIWYLTYGPGSSGLAYGKCIDIYEDFFYIGGSSGDRTCLMKYDGNLFSDNNKPNTPSKPSGPTTGKPGEEYTYTTSTTDPDGDLLSYDFYWGVWNISIVEWFNSGEAVSASNSWEERGKYNIMVRARDECGFVSDWSEPLEINIPRNRVITSPILYFLQNHLNLFPLLQKILLLQR